MFRLCMCVSPLYAVAGGLKAGAEGAGVSGADGAGGGPVVRDVLQALPHPPVVSSRIEAVKPLSVLPLGCCDGLPQPHKAFTLV